VINNELDNSRIVVEPSKETRQNSVFAIVLCFAAPLILSGIWLFEPSVLSSEEKIRMALWMMLFLFVACLPMAVWAFIILKRQLVFDKDGISVCFLKYKKFYPWSRFEVKQLINKRNSNMHSLYEGVIFFQTYDKYKKYVNSMLRIQLSLFKPPFYIPFELGGKWYERPKHPPTFEVNKEWFISEIQALGVELNESYSLFYKG